MALACLGLSAYGHEAGRGGANYIRGPLQAPLQVPAKRLSGSGSNITAFANELGPQLSSEASITLVGSDEFDDLTARWTAWAAPSFKAAVQVYTEEDVSNTVIAVNASDCFEDPQLTIRLRSYLQTNSDFRGWLSLAAMVAFSRLASWTLEFRSISII